MYGRLEALVGSKTNYLQRYFVTCQKKIKVSRFSNVGSRMICRDGRMLYLRYLPYGTYLERESERASTGGCYNELRTTKSSSACPSLRCFNCTVAGTVPNNARGGGTRG